MLRVENCWNVKSGLG
uniref:Uncharacterized protein n=1 Tax=Anguilla anguilla TaxID=7936 RepID=A0A0E9XY79_ANGAN